MDYQFLLEAVAIVTVAGTILYFNVDKTNKEVDMTAIDLTIEDEVIGAGDPVKVGDKVMVGFVGTLTNGKVFDSSENYGGSGFVFVLGKKQVIKGWEKGVLGMKVGGKRKLIVPPDLAYGYHSLGNVIPAKSTLAFEIELLQVFQ
jgi:peptidylprolyl isomerase